MNKLLIRFIALSFALLLGAMSQVQAESAAKQLQDASKGVREAASVFDGNRLR